MRGYKIHHCEFEPHARLDRLDEVLLTIINTTTTAHDSKINYTPPTSATLHIMTMLEKQCVMNHTFVRFFAAIRVHT